jgi:hypothetical protein
MKRYLVVGLVIVAASFFLGTKATYAHHSFAATYL